ncbi:hypothetical protein HaLaN_03877 [Haematococcus lacustris]|uniref:Uncharacterized protein n=1 Tax=Haematococcus lacustris TaxID=44745 RepID=A0A699YPI3_HAELA|nr:hypothetical protein HaLaN_03877 [Haematococcus lacustris]
MACEVDPSTQLPVNVPPQQLFWAHAPGPAAAPLASTRARLGALEQPPPQHPARRPMEGPTAPRSPRRDLGANSASDVMA